MGKNRNKHRNLVPNIYRLRIEEVMYIVDDKHIKFNLCYNAKTNKMSEIDNAINELIDLLNKKSDWYKSIK